MALSTIQFVCRCLLPVIVLLTSVQAAPANTKGDQLRRIMADISLLNKQMTQRKNDAVDIRAALFKRLKEIRTEAKNEMQANNVKTTKQARQISRLWLDLVLIGEIQAYITGYTRRINHYRVACDRLSYLYQQADDDLKIIEALSDMKIEALVAQTQKILDHYLADAQTIVLHPDTLTAVSPQDIFKSIK
ncbi:MAG: hypothetical protein CR984_00620 [Proteobacteria bacterium]|nr:MAG: hypothetical protein CR984_00620 [Pseudomonadota bacterium]PIE67894.1 MAG: hypothetical protein CSA23_01705 [Deltaproteobacteria bacterium]